MPRIRRYRWIRGFSNTRFKQSILSSSQFLQQDVSIIGYVYSYLHNESGVTQYTDRARHIWFDKFSALRHGDVVIVRTFVLCVLSCK